MPQAEYKQTNMQRTSHKGFALIEIVIASAIVLTGVLALSEAFTQYVSFALNNEKNLQAAYLAEEALEAITYIRDQGWTTYITAIPVSTPYYLTWSSSQWQTSTTPEYVDGLFSRAITLEPVYRDSNDRIAATGTLDPNTKFVTVSISFLKDQATTTKTMSTYIANINAD